MAQAKSMILNDAQQTAVNSTTGSTLIIAGAGSGKTRVITSRIIHLLNSEKASASGIIALTFTNKAAKEMKDRIGKQTKFMPFIGTFHSYCLNLLKKYGFYINLDSFTIMDSADQEKLVNDIIKKSAPNNKINAKQMVYHISNAKNQLAMGEQYYLFEYDQISQAILLQYEEAKRLSKCLDFDDLIIKTVELFKNQAFVTQHHTQIKHILVDEYQDTSTIQHKLLKQMSLINNKLVIDSVCVVGDEDQSIYSWRGATVDNILQFPKEFPDVQIVKIEQNYRSASSILETANLLIKNNHNRNPKKLWSDKIAENRVLMINTVSGYQEADLIAYTAMMQHQKNPGASIAVLYRTHFQSRVIEEILLKNSVPYKIIGGIQFYERKEIKDILAYLKLIINKHDRISFSRIYNCPPRKLGAQFEEQFFDLWEQEPFFNYQQVAEKLIATQELTTAKKNSLTELLNLLNQINPETQTSVAIRLLIDKLRYFDYLKESFSAEEAQNKIENVKELIRAAENFEMADIATVHGFLDEISLMQDKLNAQDEKNLPHIQLMSLHAAKGLEFDTVIIAGIEESLLPSTRSVNSSESIEEERRLLYVGITRARDHLILTHAKSRNTYGQINEQSPSRFINEISPIITQKIDLSYFNQSQINTILADFLENKSINLTNNYTGKSTDNYNNNSRYAITNKLNNAGYPSKYTSNNQHDNSDNNWKINQLVQHKVFGVGLIRKIEKRPENSILTIQFKSGLKKISDNFIQKI
jgi:DNA helicase-2/ATP-dependent DNA helicase PcrA